MRSASIETQRIVLAIFWKVMAVLSMVGSGYVICSLVGTKENRRRTQVFKAKNTFQRLLLALSVADIISSFGFFLSTWPIPEQPPIGYDDIMNRVSATFGSGGNNDGIPTLAWKQFYPFSSVNTATCASQGFIIQVGLGSSVLFTGSIAIQYVLRVKYQLTEAKMKVAERCMIAFAITFPLLFAIIIVATGAMNPGATGICWINESPWFCSKQYTDAWRQIFEIAAAEATTTTNSASVDATNQLIQYCEHYPDRRPKADVVKIFFFSFWIVLVAIIVLASMIIVYLTVRSQEQRAAKWSDAARQGRDQIRVIHKGMLFIGAYLIVWVPFTVIRFGLVRVKTTPFNEQIVLALFMPMQGILNALIHSNKIQDIWNFLTRKCN